jgi:twinkle protein
MEGQNNNNIQDEYFNPSVRVKPKLSMISGKVEALPDRGISYETCKFFNYQVGLYRGEDVHIAPIVKNGKVIAQKIRFVDTKEFLTLGNTSNLPFFGAHLWPKAYRLIITEGEIDAMSVSQAYGNGGIAVVSATNGAQSAEKNIKENILYFKNFKEIVLCFDQDEAGIEAANKCALLLPMGSTYIAHLPMKDANEMLMVGMIDDLKHHLANAVPYTPEGVVSISDRRAALTEKKVLGEFKYPYQSMNEAFFGMARTEIVMLCAGTGMGKSTLMREMIYGWIKNEHRVGILALEETTRMFDERLLSIRVNKPLHLLEDWNLNQEYLGIIDNEIFPYTEIYNELGGLNCKILMNVIEYLALAKDCPIIALDHITIGSVSDDNKDNNSVVDNMMNVLRRAAKRLNIAILVLSQLKKVQGKRFERGAEIDLDDLKGSGSLKQVPDTVMALEGDNTDTNMIRRLRKLKGRTKGLAKVITEFQYSEETGRLSEYNILNLPQNKAINYQPKPFE